MGPKLKDSLKAAKANDKAAKIAAKKGVLPKPKDVAVVAKQMVVEEDDGDDEEDDDEEEDEEEEDDDEEDEETPVLSRKEARKLKKLAAAAAAEEEDDEDSGEDSDEVPQLYDTNRLDLSESESEIENQENEVEDIPLSDVELDSDNDAIPYQKVTKNNKPALLQAKARISLPYAKMTFVDTLVHTSGAIELKDIYDDMEKELAFYKQGLEAAKTARKELLKAKVPFTRPLDYFAEMVKSDEHMEKLKQKLIEEATSKKASEEARRQRDLKKFGKKVQHNKLQERAKDKKDTLDKIKSLKRKRAGQEMTSEEFDIAVEEAASENHNIEGKNHKRQAKDAKFGFGGKKRFRKANTSESSGDMSGFNQKRNNAPVKKRQQSRPGKSRRNRG
ncbi:rRNA-processing protein [Yarrowia sp. C11]|nr:rRNA-processing protein [Yarrowia sp. C11]